MSRRNLYLVIAALAVLAAGLAAALMQERQTERISIQAGESGITIEAK